MSVIHLTRQYASLRLTNKYWYGLPGMQRRESSSGKYVSVRDARMYTHVRVMTIADGEAVT